MRVLFTSYGTRPHYFPMVPLAWACQTAGHDVRVVGAPAIAEPLRESGLLGAAVGRDADISAFMASGAFRPKPPQPGETTEEALARFVDGIAPIAFLRCEGMIEETVQFARAWRPDLVVYDPVTFAGAVAAQVLGVPAVCNLYGMVRHFRVEMDTIYGTELRSDYVNQFKRFGVEPIADPAAWVDPCPPSLRWRDEDGPSSYTAGAPRFDMQFVRYNGSGNVPNWLLQPGERPRVVFTWGTTQEKKLGPEVVQFAREAIDAIAALDVEVVVTVAATAPGNAGYLAGLPSNVRTVDWVPFQLLADASAAVVHFGGTGMMLTTAACGKPHVAITAIPEGIFNGQRIEAAGVGRHLPQEEADAAAIQSAVSAVIGGGPYQRAALNLRHEIEAQPRTSEIVRRLEEIA
ncbi:nucleotide disphospho-sugar-binding domain-containing protein [Micromonospora sp. NPDC050200]|uniref:nucleotide disphospho-sugar-binding domain-containing protein n=1 Tax=Micromonospora sp. NPDC050200 TaxID=3155664 RepID=UPI0033FB6B64